MPRADQALLMACRAVWAGGSGAYLVGGSENVGQNPYTLHFFKRNIKAALKGSLPELETADQGDTGKRYADTGGDVGVAIRYIERGAGSLYA